MEVFAYHFFRKTRYFLTKKLVCCGLLLIAINIDVLQAQSPYDETGWLPEKEQHLVYDYCGTLSAEQVSELEARLLAFNDSTSNQIVVMLTPGFGGNDISQFAFDVGEKWGIGQKEFANGVIIVIKPKDETKGEVEIATGKGLEGALPDVFCKRIIEDEMIPHFREDDYYGGIVAALDVIVPVCAGEYSYEQYKSDNKVPLFVLLIILGGFVLLIWVLSKIDKSGWGNGSNSGGRHYYGGPTHTSSWGGSSFGGFGGSHSSGGFGGFGGGSFGGGGARGSW